MKSNELTPSTVNLVESFTNDTIGRSADVWAFCEMLNNIDGSCCISIDGAWGSGKTFFVKQINMVLDALNININCGTLTVEQKDEVLNSCNKLSKGHHIEMQPQVCVYYDAWTNDNDIDPVLSIIYSILSETNSNFHFPRGSKIFERMAAVIDCFTGKNLAELLDSLKNNTIFDKLESEKSLEENIKEFFEALLPEKGNRLVIIIDELDRCKPTYAIQVLERIKHYFGNDRITFVFSINAQELEHTIRNSYGANFDAGRYLDRFFDLRIPLPEPNIEAFSRSISFSKNDNWYWVISHAFREAYDLQMREICRYASAIHRAEPHEEGSGLQGESMGYAKMIFVPILVGLKLINASLYESFIRGNDSQPLIKVAKNIPKGCFDFLLNEDEVYEDDKDILSINPVNLEKRLDEYYKAVFAKPWPSTSNFKPIGSIHVHKNTANALIHASSGLEIYGR